MKTTFTYLFLCFLSIAAIKNSNAQCNNPSGSNGISIGAASLVVIDGNMADWSTFLNDPDNNSYDNTNGIDLDAPISDAGRDLVRFTFTEDLNYLYIYLQRAGSVTNNVDVILYLDINNNDLMDSNEPVVHLTWGGSNGNVSGTVLSYVPHTVSFNNALTLNGDGKMLMGNLTNRSNVTGITGMGASNGVSLEARIPYSVLTQLSAGGNVLNTLQPGKNFKMHVSTMNGNISSIPGHNSINDNFGGCLVAPELAKTLPVKLKSFTATLANENRVNLSWTTAAEINVSHFVVERSFDGSNFNEAGLVFASGSAATDASYAFPDNITAVRSNIIYYRLRSVDNDGKTQLSEVRIIRIGKNNSILKMTVFPNPATNTVNISLPAEWQNKKTVYELISANGQVAKRVETTNSSQTETMNLSSLAPGFYIIKVSCDNQTAQQRIVKQ